MGGGGGRAFTVKRSSSQEGRISKSERLLSNCKKVTVAFTKKGDECRAGRHALGRQHKPLQGKGPWGSVSRNGLS